MSERQAALCSVGEYTLRLEGHEQEVRRRWEMLRWQTWQLLTPNFKKGRAPQTPQAFCRFPWERLAGQEAEAKLEASRVTEQEAEALNKLFAALDAGGTDKNKTPKTK